MAGQGGLLCRKRLSENQRLTGLAGEKESGWEYIGGMSRDEVLGGVLWTRDRVPQFQNPM
jgi:hypothetical protein